MKSPVVGIPVAKPKFAMQCEEIRRVIRELREKLTFVSVRNEEKEETANLRDGHLSGELQDILTQLKDLLSSVQY